MPFRPRRFGRTVVSLMLFALATLMVEAAEARGRGNSRGSGYHGRGFGRALFYRPFYTGYSHFGYFGHFGYGGYGYGYGPVGSFARGPEGGIDPTVARLEGWGAVDLDIKPRKAEVWVDGDYLGTVADFDGYPSFLWLDEGRHSVVVRSGGYQDFEEQLEIRPGVVIRRKLRLEEGANVPPAGR